MFISCKQCYVPSTSIGQVLAIFYLKRIGIGSADENWYRCITSSGTFTTPSLTPWICTLLPVVVSSSNSSIPSTTIDWAAPVSRKFQQVLSHHS